MSFNLKQVKHYVLHRVNIYAKLCNHQGVFNRIRYYYITLATTIFFNTCQNSDFILPADLLETPKQLTCLF